MSNQVNKENETGNSNTDYTIPEYQKTAFHCPHCDVYAKQNWHEVFQYNHNDLMRETKRHLNTQGAGNIGHFFSQMYYDLVIQNSNISFCDHCKKYSIWVDQKMVYPHLSTAPLPIAEMPESVKDLYNEARDIANRSPRGACALLRLAIEVLIKELGEDKINLNTAIGNLVKKGLPKRIQKALDAVRVIGNNAVHPGEIDIKDNPEIAISLFMLINFISEKMITEDKKVDAIYSSLPSDKIKAINERDGKI